MGFNGNVSHYFSGLRWWRHIQIAAWCIAVAACTPNQKRDTKFQQYFVEGEQLYLKNCSNCHQKNGVGLGRLYPPLNKSDFMDKSLDEVICAMRNGLEGELIVNGEKYNMPMKGIPSLTDLEIAEIATYIYNSWTHSKGIVEISTVEKALTKCEPK